MKNFNSLGINWVFLALLLTGCGLTRGLLTTVGPDYQNPGSTTAKHWYAKQQVTINIPVAHQGSLSNLHTWWERFADPVFTRLLAAAQQLSSDVANARAKIEEARANLVASDAAFLPSLDSSLSSSRSSFSFGQTPFIRNQHQLSVQSNWEIDLFGGLTREREASLAQLAARTASWHDARVAVAAELANAYLAYRYCEAQVHFREMDAESRQESAQLLTIAANAGFRNTADVALANASAADGNNMVVAQKAQCDRSIKSLVALTNVEEDQLRTMLGKSPEQKAKLPSPPPFEVKSVPAEVIRQRPDVAVAERNMAEASAKIGVEQANRFPKLSLSGNITPVFQNINGSALLLANTWSIGPTLSLPLFDAGKRAANVEKAKAQYVAATADYQRVVRVAVKEVEEAMVRIASAEERLPLAIAAVADYRTHFESTQKLFTTGLGNLIDVESSRRNLVAAELAIKDLEQEKVSAWIALYRAVGGSWEDNKAQILSTATLPLPTQSGDTIQKHPFQKTNNLSGE